MPSGTDGLHDDALLDEVHRGLGQVLHALGHHLLLAAEQEEDDGEQHGEHAHQGDLVEPVPGVGVGPKALGHSTRFWIGGNSSSASSAAITRSTTPSAQTGRTRRGDGLEPGEGERGRDVPHLPEQQAEVGDDDGDAAAAPPRPTRCGARRPARRPGRWPMRMRKPKRAAPMSMAERDAGRPGRGSRRSRAKFNSTRAMA